MRFGAAADIVVHLYWVYTPQVCSAICIVTCSVVHFLYALLRLLVTDSCE